MKNFLIAAAVLITCLAFLFRESLFGKKIAKP